MIQKTYYAGKAAGIGKIEAPGGINEDSAKMWLDAHDGPVGEDSLELISHYGIAVPKSGMASSEKKTRFLGEYG